MKRIAIGIIFLFASTQLLFAQPTTTKEELPNFGVCMNITFLAAMSAAPMMLIHFVGAANGADSIRKTLDIQVSELGVDPTDAGYFFHQLRQSGKSLEEAIANQPSIEVVWQHGLKTMASCLARKGVTLDDKGTDRCIGLGNLGFRIAYLRASEVPRHEVEEQVVASAGKQSDEGFKHMAKGIVDRVYGEGSRISLVPDNRRKAALMLVSQDEFSRCVDATK